MFENERQIQGEPAQLGTVEEKKTLTQWVIKYSGGLIRTERQANYFLVAFIVGGIILSLILMFGTRGKPAPLPPNAKIIFPPGEPPRLEKPLPR